MGTGIEFFIISLAFTAASAYIQKQQADAARRRLKDSLKALSADKGQEIKSNTRSASEPIRVIYGKHRVGDNEVFFDTQGNKNKYAYLAHTLCEGEIEGIVDDENGNPYIWFDGERIYDKYSGLYSYQEKKGTSTQNVSSLINNAVSSFTDTMRYTTYVAWRLTYDEDKFRGIPNIQYLVKGKKLYDFRNDTTAWSDNPVLALYDVFTNSLYGLNRNSSEIDLDSWEEAADYCEAKGFTIDTVFNISESNIWEIVEDISRLFRGTLNYWDGKYYLRFYDMNEESSVMTIEDKHIFQDEGGKAIFSISDPGSYNYPKGLRITFINAENDNYNQDSFIIGEEDGVVEDYELFGCTDRETAGILGVSELERRQLARTISGRFRDDCLLLEPGDLLTVNSSSLAVEDEAMRVVSAAYSNMGFIDLVLQYESLDIYNDVYDIDLEGEYETSLPDPSTIIPVTNPTITEAVYDYRMRSFSRLDIEFTVGDNNPWFKQVEVWVSTDGDVEANYKHQFNATDSFSIDPVEEGEIYYVILRTVNIWGAKQDLSDSTKLSKLITGKSDTPPPSLSELIATPIDGGVRLSATKLNNPDIEIYEFRLGSQWTGGVFFTAKRSPHEVIPNVKPGTHTFWCNTKGTNGLYGETPVNVTVTIEEPKGWSDYTSFTDDYLDSTSGQVFYNTEHTIYSADDYLKCSHQYYESDSTSITFIDTTSGDVYLLGHYESEVFDTGVAAQKYFIYLDADMVTTGLGTTWGDVIGPTGIWSNVNIETRNWKDIFEIEEAPQVVIKIYHKAEVGHSWSVIENAEILSAVINARYFKVRIDIIDPAENVNALIENYTLKLLT